MILSEKNKAAQNGYLGIRLRGGYWNPVNKRVHARTGNGKGSFAYVRTESTARQAQNLLDRSYVQSGAFSKAVGAWFHND